MVQSYMNGARAASLINADIASLSSSLVKYRQQHGDSPSLKKLESLILSYAQRIIMTYMGLDEQRNKFQQCKMFLSRLQDVVSKQPDESLAKFLDRHIRFLDDQIPTL